MPITLQEKKFKPPRIMLYGVHGLGKTTFGALAPDPIFLPLEDGLDAVDVDAFPLATDFSDVLKNLGQLATEDHNYKTLVIDSVDWLEPLIWRQVCNEHGVDSIEKVLKGYGKGYTEALNVWSQYIDALNYLRNEKDMMIIQLAHTHVKRFENPETDAYDRYEMKLNAKASAKLQENADIVLFANYYVAISKDDSGGFKERKRAVGSGERVLYTTERPAATAKNRYDLPEQIPFDKEGEYWDVLKSHIPYFNQTEKDASHE